MPAARLIKFSETKGNFCHKTSILSDISTENFTFRTVSGTSAASQCIFRIIKTSDIIHTSSTLLPSLSYICTSSQKRLFNLLMWSELCHHTMVTKNTTVVHEVGSPITMLTIGELFQTEIDDQSFMFHGRVMLLRRGSEHVNTCKTTQLRHLFVMHHSRETMAVQHCAMLVSKK